MSLLLFSSLFVALLSHAPPAPLPPPVCAYTAATDSAAAIPLRPLRRWIRDLIVNARARSATLDCLIRAAESSGATIYIDEAEADDRDWDARTLLTAVSGGYTYLRIEVRRLLPNDSAALLAHELQHAQEIVAAGVTSPEEVVRLYQKIGEERRGMRERRFETAAAVRAGRAALLELRQRVRPRGVLAAE